MHLLYSRHPRVTSLLILIVLALVLYGLLPQLSSLQGSVKILTTAHVRFVVLAILAYSLTFVAATIIYKFLAFKKLQFWTTLGVQLAAMGINRLLPAGSGAIATNIAYLRSRRHSWLQASVVVAMNNTLGVVGHSLLLLAALPFIVIRPQLHRINHQLILLIMVGLVIALITAISVKILQPKRLIAATQKSFMHYKRRPGEVFGALVFSVALTSGNVMCLWFCGQALGLHFSLVAALVALTLGVGLGAATPTPGGLGGVEAGVYAGLVLQHVTSSAALTTALLYRLVSFWLPTVLGIAAWGYVRHQKLF